MSLSNLWLQLHDGSLIRADQIVGIDVHQTPELAGKPSRWLLDVVLAVPVGGGGPDMHWNTGPLHRTLVQTSTRPDDAPAALARLLAQLDARDAAGVVRASASAIERDPHPDHTLSAGPVRLGYTAFASGTAPGIGVGAGGDSNGRRTEALNAAGPRD